MRPRYREVYQRFKDAILQGAYPHGDRVPSIRTLAAELKLSRTTIEKAYDLLIGEGLLVSHGQSGTSVSYIPPRKTALRPPSRAERPAAARNFSGRVAAGPVAHDTFGQLNLGKPSHAGADPFQICVPAIDAFPLAAWLKVSQRVFKDRSEMSQVVDDVQGYRGLRERICGYLGVSRGISCRPHQVFITTGYRQSLSLLVNALIPRGAEIWTEDPGYPPTYSVLRQFGACPIPVPVDGEGVDVEAGRQRAPSACMAVTTPARQSPLGVCMSLRRRAALVDWAAEASAWVVEDDHDNEFCTDGKHLPVLQNLDANGRTFYLGTFSKTLHPNLRIAYMVSPDAAVAAVREAASAMLDGVSLAQQKVLTGFIADGHFALHVKKSRILYMRRRKMMVDALTSRLGSRLLVSPKSRGLQEFLVTIESPLSDVAICKAARLKGLSLSSLSSRYINAPLMHGLLLGFANFLSTPQLLDSIDVLEECIDDLHKGRTDRSEHELSS